MRNRVLFLLLLFPFLAFSQDTYTYKRGGKIFENNVKLTSTDVESYFGNNKEILHLYNSGRGKKIAGNILLYSGITTIILKHISVINKSHQNNVEYGNNGVITFTSPKISNTLYFVGGGLAILSIPIKTGYTKRIKKAVNLMNEEVKNQKSGFDIQTTSFLANSNGIGISITF